MSKNFELMQQAGIRMEHDRPAVPSLNKIVPLVPSQADHKNGHNQRRRANDEALRLVQQIFLLQTHEPPRVVVFAGIDHGNGCSHICAAVAETLARNTLKPVCLVEANFRSPSLPGFFGTTNHHGLTDALLRKGSIKSFAKLVSGDNMWLLSSGVLAADSANLITSDHLRQGMAELREEFNFVIIDAPPLTQYSDAMVLGQLSDGLVLILEAESTRREAALVVAANLRSLNVPILAVVLNKHTFPIP
jgi:receptor protein-tyrosine kinase